jgi:hypothetical protein
MSLLSAVAEMFAQPDDPWMLENQHRIGYHYNPGMDTADEALAQLATERRTTRENAQRVMHGRHAMPDTRLRRVS